MKTLLVLVSVLFASVALAGGTANVGGSGAIIVSEISNAELMARGVCFTDEAGLPSCRAAILEGANDIDESGDVEPAVIGDTEASDAIARTVGADRVATVTLGTDTTVSLTTPCEKAGDVRIETDAVANNYCTCTNATTEAWLCADAN